MAAVITRTGLIEYCLRELGEPVVEINVDEQQIEDRVDEAIEYFRQYHYDGIEKVYLKHLVTTDDVTQKSIPMTDLVYGVTRVFPIATGTSTSKSIFDLQYQLRLNDLYDLTSTSIIYYTQVMAHLSLLDMTLNGHPLYRFNRLTNRLYIEEDWAQNIAPGTFLLIECYRALDPATVPRMYGDIWLKHYTTALIKKQWATNLKKFSGMSLPGGVTIDGDRLYQEAKDEIEKLEQDMISRSAPLEFMMG
jgi:hypothetical protein